MINKKKKYLDVEIKNLLQIIGDNIFSTLLSLDAFNNISRELNLYEFSIEKTQKIINYLIAHSYYEHIKFNFSPKNYEIIDYVKTNYKNDALNQLTNKLYFNTREIELHERDVFGGNCHHVRQSICESIEYCLIHEMYNKTDATKKINNQNIKDPLSLYCKNIYNGISVYKIYYITLGVSVGLIIFLFVILLINIWLR